MNQVVIELRETGTGWVATATGCLTSPVRRKYEHALDLARKEFLRTAKRDKDPLVDDYQKALDKKLGNKPKVKFTGLNETGMRTIEVTYSLKPPPMWKQERIL